MSACGGDDEEDAQAIIDEAFTQPIESADVTLNVDLELDQGEEPSDPIRVQLSGPYRSGGPDQIPSFDFDVALQGGGADVPPFRLISTGDNVFVELQGTAYEVGEDVVAEQNRQLAEGDGEAEGLGGLGIDPRRWIQDGRIEGEEEVAGVPTTHVSASVDVPQLLADLNAAAEQAEEVGAGPAPTLDEEERSQVADAVEDPRFDLFAAEEDRTLRRLATTLSFEVPEESRPDVGGVESGTLSFSIEFANVGGDQEIVAPEDARPLEDLFQQILGLGGLGDSAAPGLPEQAPDEPDGGEAAPPDPQAFEEYGECLQQADPSDQEALADCAELLVP